MQGCVVRGCDCMLCVAAVDSGLRARLGVQLQLMCGLVAHWLVLVGLHFLLMLHVASVPLLPVILAVLCKE